ncbi:polysaccharide deacetylase [Paenibacillus sp.]|uniref:polysaccharide deacetylase n=1 Tax=Paenibacillus sp. TaxID=58172 RepID=UPI002D3243BE|nr:polysaccharide deacetylase family protein [Paenibacillus sp.]HZG56446.1 polysaccharide deacetylase family protein [Paenibacillus sp.]
MVGSWSKRVAGLTLASMLLLLWPSTAEEADVQAAPERERPIASGQPAPAVREERAAISLGAAVEEASPTPEAVSAAAAPEPEPEAEPAPRPAIDPRELFARLSAGDPTDGMLPQDDRYVTPEQPTVYLTFDDGPSKWTPKVLDVLREYGVPATFFVLGELAEEQEETIRRIVREGHALGNHTYNHKYDELYGSFETFFEQAERTGEALERITGERVSLLRAPGGTARNFDAFYFYYLEAAGYVVHDWNVDSGDSKRRGVPASEIVANVKRAKLQHEMNVLLHDGAGHEESVKALPEIIEYFLGEGYRFAALTEEVKPIAFHVGKVKWARSMDAEKHERLLALVEPSPTVTVLSAEAPPAEPVPPARTDDDREPLRAWAERAGAAVAWDAEGETAAVTLGQKTFYWSVRAGSGWIVDAAGRRAPATFELELRDERLYAPAAELASALQAD